jgi:hypothetical protein
MVPEARLKQLQAQGRDGRPLRVLGQWPVKAQKAIAVERYVHHWLRDKHYRGEWFTVTLDEARVAVEHGIANMAQLDHRNLIPQLDPGARRTGFAEQFMMRLPKGSVARIDAVLGNDETRSAFIREAIERELARRGEGQGA